jgi:enhanced disease susceptibility 1 protein
MGGDGGRPPFGDAEVDPALFPSLRAVGSGIPARTNAAFLAAFRRLLDGSTLQSEVASLINPLGIFVTRYCCC